MKNKNEPTLYQVPIGGRFEYEALTRLKELFPDVRPSYLIDLALESLLVQAEKLDKENEINLGIVLDHFHGRAERISDCKIKGKKWWLEQTFLNPAPR